MKIAQTSLVVFLSKVVGSALGFVSTWYFARVLGADVIGVFAGVIALTAWLQMGGNAGIGEALQKRISEGEHRDQYLFAALVLLVLYVVVVSLLVVVLSDFVEWYLSDFDQYAPVSVVWFVIGVLVARLSFNFVSLVLRGEHLVHIAGFLDPVKIGVRSLLQIALVFAGFQLVGMLVGYIAGIVLVALFGTIFVTSRLARPSLDHIRSLFEYARFSWFAGLKSRALNDIDILVLTALVPSGLVGVYSVAWSLSKFLDLFGSAVSKAVFPEISETSAAENPSAAADLIDDAIAYGGLIAIPGVVGGTILADRLLRIYGPEFEQGATVLWLLLVAVMLYSYLRQFLNALNAVDRPDQAFRINVVFVSTNVVLNVILIWAIGWVGAAIASVVSTGLALVVAAYILEHIVPFQFPAGEISRQFVAAAGMGVIVMALRTTVESRNLLGHNFALVAGLVFVGAGVYGVFLSAISSQFRKTVVRNLPFDLPT